MDIVLDPTPGVPEPGTGTLRRAGLTRTRALVRTWSAAALFLFWLLLEFPPPVSPLLVAAVVTFCCFAVWDTAKWTAEWRLKRSRPCEPWLWDEPWDRTGITRRPWRGVTAFLGALPLVALLVAKHGFDAGPLMLLDTLGRIGPMLEIVMGVVLTVHVFVLFRRWTFGATRLGFRRFPYHPGERMELTFGVHESGGRFKTVDFTLRCVHETRRNWGLRFTRESFEQWYFLRDDQPLPSGDAEIELHFDLPARVPGNSLHTRNRRWWELIVQGETDGGKFREIFLLPVYVRPDQTSGVTR